MPRRLADRPRAVLPDPREGTSVIRDYKRPLSGVVRALLRPGGLQDQADEVLRRRLAVGPRNTDTLWKLAEIHRRQGNFAAARSLYRRLRERGSDPPKAAWLHAMLSGNGAPEPAPGGTWPAPFVRMTNFLAPGECERLLALGLAAREQLTPARVGAGHGRLDPEARVNLEICDRRTETEVRLQIVPKVRSLVPEILARLRMDGIGRCSIEMSIRVYLDGGFYRAHSDNHKEHHHQRKLSFVYFLHREPRRFSGGDLLLHDTDIDARTYSFRRFSRIVPLRNSIVFFPSGYCHQVTPVRCGTDDFGDGRWAVNGHVRHTDEANASPEGLQRT